MRARHTTAWAAIVMAALWPLLEETRASSAVSVDIEGELFNVAVTEPTKLDDVLKRLGEALGARVEGGGCAKRIGPISLRRVTFDAAVRSLAPDHSLIVEHASGTAKVRRILLIEAVTEVPPGPDVAVESSPPPVDENADDADAGEPPEADPPQDVSPSREAARNPQASSLRDIVKLGYSKDQSSTQQLEKLARSSSDPATRAAALSTLSKSSSLGAVRFLKSRLFGDPDPQMRLAAAQALYHVDRKQSKTLIDMAIKMERDPELRKQLQALADN